MVGLARGPAAPQFNVAHAMTNEINLAHTKINEIQQRNNLSRHRPPCNHRFRFSRDSFHIPVPLTSLALAVCGGDLFQVAHDTMQDLRCTRQPFALVGVALWSLSDALWSFSKALLYTLATPPDCLLYVVYLAS